MRCFLRKNRILSEKTKCRLSYKSECGCRRNAKWSEKTLMIGYSRFLVWIYEQLFKVPAFQSCENLHWWQASSVEMKTRYIIPEIPFTIKYIGLISLKASWSENWVLFSFEVKIARYQKNSRTGVCYYNNCTVLKMSIRNHLFFSFLLLYG